MNKRLACMALAFGAMAFAAKSKQEAKPDLERVAPERQLQWVTGTVTLGDGIATLRVPEGFRYLRPVDTTKVLTAWGNPPRETLGMLFPKSADPFAGESWGVVITFDEDGYVKDDDAASLNYNDILKEMKEATRKSNEERKAGGYETVDLVGWAEQPHYDKAAHKLFWAKNLKFGSAPENTLNYNVRALGRRGVLVLNAVASMGQLPEVAREMKSVIPAVEFAGGHRYQDFDASADKVAAYGIGALIAGKVASKVGFFGALLGLLAGMKKLAFVAVAALLGLLKKLFTGRGETAPEGEQTSA